MKTRAFNLFFLLFVPPLSAEDAPAPPAKKKVIPKIPHAWFSEGIVCLQAKQSGFDFANQAQSVAHSSNFTLPSTITPHFKWNCGLRIDAGYQPDNIYFFGSWTYIQNTADGKKETEATSGFFPVLSLDKRLSSQNYVTSASFNDLLKTQFTNIGATFSWTFKSPFILKHHVGVRIASINQKFSASYGGGIFNEGMDILSGRNNFLGIGPRIGLAPNIILPWGFSLVGDISASALLGRFSVKQKETYLNQTLFNNTHVMTRLRLGIDAQAYLAWQKEILYKSLVISVQAGWEWHKFYDQNELTYNSLSFPNGSKNLFLRGGFLSFCLGF